MLPSFVRRSSSLILACALLAVQALALANPLIRLQNEILHSGAVNRAPGLAAGVEAIPPSGLALIQFTNSPQPEWREQLATLGVDLLHYVPDNAFVADLNGGPPDLLRKLNFVAWVGPYRPEHKLHRALRTVSLSPGTNTAAKAIASANLAVSVLISPRAKASESQSARGLFDRVDRESPLRIGTVLHGQINPNRLQSLAESRAVLWIEPAPKMRLYDEVASRIVAGDGPPHQTLMQSLGYNGAGVTVAVADSGLDSGDTNSMHPDIQGRVRALFHYGAPGQLDDAADEHSHGTHCAGIVAGNGATGEADENDFLYGVGVAPGASLIAQRIFDGVGGYAPPPSFEALTRDAKRAGADVGSNSWGDDTQGAYDLSAMEFDELVRDADALTFGDQPYILEFSAGNAGPAYQTVGSPAVAKNVIATGAAQNDRFTLPMEEFSIYTDGRETMADFSSRGPCADGRIKPDVVAPGTWIASLRSIYANDDYAWWPISDNYLYQGGTSQAGPHVAGAAAVFVQYWRATHAGATPSPALTKAALINSATDMDDGFTTDAVPNGDEGWGRVDLPALIGSARNYDFTDQTILLTNGGGFEHRVLIGSASEPLKITLAYTDEPGLPAAAIALVNDLDLEVISPDGHLYRGNQFQDGDSIPDAPGPDTINNVEAVHLYAPAPGEYIIRVRGSRIVEDARRDTVPVDQDFALVISGKFGTAGRGIATFDRRVYRAPDQIKLALVDYDLAGQATASLILRSGAEPAGEVITLHANGSSGLFTGAVATATSSVPGDGNLQVAHGNVIEAVYADATPAANRSFTALADLQSPVITNVQATNQFGQVVVSWATDEAAKAVLYYGTNPPNLAVTNAVFDLEQALALPRFPNGTVLKFMAVAEDEAGNRATNNNGGAFFTITNVQPPDILLLDSYSDNGGLIAAPPLSGYTDALTALGRGYGTFNTTTSTEPTLAQLQSHRCVIWRMDEISAPPATLVQKIAAYVNSGGSLFISSMDGTTRLTEAGQPGFIHTILQLQSYTEDQPVNDILGAPGDPVGTGIDTPLDYAPYDELLTFLAMIGVSDPSDWVAPNTNATSILLADGAIVGVRSPKPGVELAGRVVYLSFPLDAVPLGSGGGNNRAGLLRNILNFLAPPANTSTLTLDSDVYSVPGRAVIEVEDADLQGQKLATVNVHSPQHPNQLTVTLFETARLGLFRGNVSFASTNTGPPGTLVVQANDTVEFDYFDASASSTVSATATIETNAPTITNVSIEPGYLEALVSWDTSKPADTLVQYSEAPDNFPNNFTAYDPVAVTAHEIYLNGLKANTTYYVRVSSRDRAGNNTTDDNAGKLYKFTTLLPLTPPWFDNLETNSLDWSTFASTDSETNWTRGWPGGGETPHSGDNCWGSNLGGEPVSQLEAYLISPGVLLNGGNKATLRFWHNYDFLPAGDFDVQLAAVEIITNIASGPIVLAQMPEDASGAWEPAEIDLTPYLGTVVYIVWYHFLFSFDAPPRLGWLVDDVSITTETIVPGTVQITNNVWQATYALSGPSGRTGNGRSFVITNAAPGKYTVQFGDAPYLVTPAPQTNTLVAGGVATFAGNYTFTDANSNGIPDAYEVEKFGALDPLRTKLTDTDRDGLSDWAEFVAGTDPTSPPPPFQITARFNNGLGQLSWPSVPNHTYRIHGSSNAVNWSPYSAFLSAGGTTTTFALPVPTNHAPNFFRVEAMPPTGPTAIAPFLRVTATPLTNGLLRLDWPAGIGHGYRLLSSTNAAIWTAATDWLRASKASGSATISTKTNAAVRFLRVEAQP